MAIRYLFLNGITGRNSIAGSFSSKPNPLDTWPDDKLIREFRMTKREIQDVCNLVRDDLQPVGNRSIDLTLEQKVLICLKTLKSGSFQNCSKDFMDVSQPTVSVVLAAFMDSIIKKASHFIYMPRSRDEILKAKNELYQIASLPGTIGCIDCTHIPIIAPHENEYAYVNRKKFHSINVQAVCDANFIFQDIVAKWPGSHHDSFILNTSSLYNRFEQGEFGDCWLLGDSGYSLKSWLITPLSSPSTHQERKFNKVHRKTRCLIERAFGLLKSRWRILDHTGGYLCYCPTKVAKMTLTCCILHNICLRNGTPILGPNPPIIPLHVPIVPIGSSTASGIRQRDRIIAMI